MAQVRYTVELRQTGRVVAVGGLDEATNGAPRGNYWMFGFVRPEFQRQGIGSQLYVRLLEDAGRLNGLSLRASVRGQDTSGLAFLAKRGFTERRRSWQSVLDLESADTSRLPSLLETLNAVGIVITTAHREGVENPQVVQELNRLDNETSHDVPRLGAYVDRTVEEFRRGELENPRLLADAWFIAKVGNRYVAMSNGERETADPDTLLQAYTCTLREYRRRGLALALKLCVIDYGRRHHFRRIRTFNDSLNTSMWKLNERLGFRQESIWIQTEKTLSTNPP
jgi:GNAT superfamily N-acetyltransferase